jgi:hypothetical protein
MICGRLPAAAASKVIVIAIAISARVFILNPLVCFDFCYFPKALAIHHALKHGNYNSELVFVHFGD